MSNDVYVWSLDGRLCKLFIFVGSMRLSRSGKLKKIMLNHQIRMLKLLGTNVHGTLDK